MRLFDTQLAKSLLMLESSGLDDIVFHATTVKRAKSILANGLGGKGKKFASGMGLGGWGDYTPKHENMEYITTLLGVAFDYAYNIAEDKSGRPAIVVLKIHDPNDVVRDEDDIDTNENTKFCFATGKSNLEVIGAFRLPSIGSVSRWVAGQPPRLGASADSANIPSDWTLYYERFLIPKKVYNAVGRDGYNWLKDNLTNI